MQSHPLPLLLWIAIMVTYSANPTARTEPVEVRTFVVRRAHHERGGLRHRIYAQEDLVSVLLASLAVAFLTPFMPATVAMGLDELPYVPYVSTPAAVVNEMLEIANVGAKDIVYDLGSGDGRIVIAAAKRFGARGVGIEINPDLIREASENAEKAGVAHLVRFVEGDFFVADLRQATVVTLYLLPEVNRQLLPKLLAELRPGTRVVSYKYDLGDWAPEKSVQASRGTVYYWVVPQAARR